MRVIKENLVGKHPKLDRKLKRANFVRAGILTPLENQQMREEHAPCQANNGLHCDTKGEAGFATAG